MSILKLKKALRRLGGKKSQNICMDCEFGYCKEKPIQLKKENN